MDIKKETKENAEVVLSGILPAKDIEPYWDNALNAAQKELNLPGFRKGHVPTEKVIEEVGAGYLWKEAAEMALKEALPEVLEKQEVMPIMPLGLSLKKAEKGEDVSFEITAVTPPACEAGDYKKAVKEALDALPKEDAAKEKTEAVHAFRTQVRAISKMKNPEEVKEGDAKENAEKADEPLNDDEAKVAGFENGKAIEHFIDGEADKAVAERSNQKKRAAVAEALITAATAQIPKAIIEDETKALVDVFKRDVVNQGMEWNEYLKRVNKDEQAVQNDLRPQAEKRITLDLVFGEIIKQEKIQLGEEEKKKEEEIAQALLKQEVPHDRALAYAKEQLLREKVWEFLGVKIKTPEPEKKKEEKKPETKS